MAKAQTPATAPTPAPRSLGAAATPTDAAVVVDSDEDEDEDESKSIAKHALVDASGAVTKKMEDAVGIVYTDRASGLSVTYRPTANSMLMQALFGSKTLATNKASRVRQQNGKQANGPAEIAAIEAMFADHDNGVWLVRTRVAFKPDPAIVAKAWADAAQTLKGLTAEQHAKFEKAAADKMAADPAMIDRIYNSEGVEAAYRKLTNRPAKQTRTVDELTAELGL